jgi:hypothetical protein
VAQGVPFLNSRLPATVLANFCELLVQNMGWRTKDQKSSGEENEKENDLDAAADR